MLSTQTTQHKYRWFLVKKHKQHKYIAFLLETTYTCMVLFVYFFLPPYNITEYGITICEVRAMIVV